MPSDTRSIAAVSHDAYDSRLRRGGQRDRDARARGRIQGGLTITFEISSEEILSDSHSLLMFNTNHLLHQRLKTRIATERIEHRINFNQGDA